MNVLDNLQTIAKLIMQVHDQLASSPQLMQTLSSTSITQEIDTPDLHDTPQESTTDEIFIDKMSLTEYIRHFIDNFCESHIIKKKNSLISMANMKKEFHRWAIQQPDWDDTKVMNKQIGDGLIDKFGKPKSPSVQTRDPNVHKSLSGSIINFPLDVDEVYVSKCNPGWKHIAFVDPTIPMIGADHWCILNTKTHEKKRPQVSHPTKLKKNDLQSISETEIPVQSPFVVDLINFDDSIHIQPLNVCSSLELIENSSSILDIIDVTSQVETFIDKSCSQVIPSDQQLEQFLKTS